VTIKGEFSILALFLNLMLIAVSGIVYWKMSPMFTPGEISFNDPEFFIAVPLF